MIEPPPPPKSRKKRWKLFEVFRVYGPDASLYLWRLNVILTPWFGIRLHVFIRPDGDRHLHDHPWWFLSLVLWGGYDEITKEEGEVIPRRVRWINTKRATDAHTVTTLHRRRVVTVLLTGRKVRKWGFLVDEEPGGWVHHTEYHQRYVAPLWEEARIPDPYEKDEKR